MNNLFANCSSLTEILIPEGVTYVGSFSFKNCTAIKTLDLPESVTKIGEMPFSGCKMNALYIRGIIESGWITSNLFRDMDIKTEIYVQPSEVEKFQQIYKGKVYPLSGQTKVISETISPTDTPSEIFDLKGNRIANRLQKGIFIQSGKKILK
jgi:hypothetical protein